MTDSRRERLQAELDAEYEILKSAEDTLAADERYLFEVRGSYDKGPLELKVVEEYEQKVREHQADIRAINRRIQSLEIQLSGLGGPGRPEDPLERMRSGLDQGDDPFKR